MLFEQTSSGCRVLRRPDHNLTKTWKVPVKNPGCQTVTKPTGCTLHIIRETIRSI
jgi:hypothetical protein